MRYSPDRPFPHYAFLPGRNPHPTRDPEGHSYHKEEARAAYFDAADWRENDDYLFGVDLYNHGYLWEAHEAWEGLWHRARKDAWQALFLQGLIQCSAGCLKILMKQPRGVRRLTELGTGKLQGVSQAVGDPYMGLKVFSFVASMRAFVKAEPEIIGGRPRIELELE